MHVNHYPYSKRGCLTFLNEALVFLRKIYLTARWATMKSLLVNLARNDVIKIALRPCAAAPLDKLITFRGEILKFWMYVVYF